MLQFSWLIIHTIPFFFPGFNNFYHSDQMNQNLHYSELVKNIGSLSWHIHYTSDSNNSQLPCSLRMMFHWKQKILGTESVCEKKKKKKVNTWRALKLEKLKSTLSWFGMPVLVQPEHSFLVSILFLDNWCSH